MPPASTLQRLVVTLSVKADAIDQSARTFEGLAAVWSLDLGNDIIKKGAFKNTLVEWKSSGNAIPLVNSHDHWNIMSALGQLLDAAETKDGLWTKWEVIEGPDGDATLLRLRPSVRTGRAVIGKMSIGYEPIKWSFEQPEGSTNMWDRIRHLEEVSLKEVSLVLFPMAPGANIDAATVKHFLASAQDTDPALVSVDTKQELRRLASRIGILLSPRKNAEDEEPSAPPPPPPTPAPSPIPPPPPPAQGTTPAAATAASEDPDTDAIDALASGDSPEPEKAASVYLYSEALEQRMRKVLLGVKVSAITHPF